MEDEEEESSSKVFRLTFAVFSLRLRLEKHS